VKGWGSVGSYLEYDRLVGTGLLRFVEWDPWVVGGGRGVRGGGMGGKKAWG
jgi:hypothetical protein